jgi:hypothetical protein
MHCERSGRPAHYRSEPNVEMSKLYCSAERVESSLNRYHRRLSRPRFDRGSLIAPMDRVSVEDGRNHLLRRRSPVQMRRIVFGEVLRDESLGGGLAKDQMIEMSMAQGAAPPGAKP